MKYKIYISKDEINFEWVLIDDYFRPPKVIYEPAIDELSTAKLKYYSKTNICYRCRKKWERGEIPELTYNSILSPSNALRDSQGNWNCRRCVEHDTIKSMADRRRGYLHNPRIIFADNCEKLTDKIFYTKRLSIEYDNYEVPLDHSPVPNGISVMIGGKLVDLSRKIIQTKGSKYNLIERCWAAKFKNDWHKNFDYEIIWCMSHDRNTVERGYVIPKIEILNTVGISIVKNPCKGIQWYEQYRMNKDLIKKANEIWTNILNLMDRSYVV